jgi:hypothetical protein
VERTDRDVDGFLRGLEGRQGDDMRALDAAISERMPGRERALFEGKFWGGTDQVIVGYGHLEYTDSKGKTGEWFVVGLAAQKRHISVYVNAKDDDGYMVRRYEGRLGKAKVGASVITFSAIDDIDLPVLLELVSAAEAAAD